MCQDRITPLLASILECVEARAVDCEATPWCRVGLVGGFTAWDDCCDCGKGSGQLWVRLADWAPDPDFPPPDSFGCDQPTLLRVGVGSLRCVPVVDETGHAPSATEEAAAATQLHDDAQLIYNAVMCCVEERTWEGWSPLGYLGGCGGGEHFFMIPFPSCRCDDGVASGS